MHADHLNTPRRLSDSTGQSRWQWPYSGFGEIAPQSTPATGQAPVNYSLRYPGQIDDGNELFYNWHRFYDPRLGRYVSSDPIGLEGGFNRFGYVGGNPLQGSDPNGLWKVHGNWCGGDWTGGHKHRYFPASDGYYLPPIDATDSACKRHDVKYYLCRKAFPCDKDKREQCQLQADRGLAEEIRFNSGAAEMAIYSWMSSAGPLDDENDPSCTCTPHH